MSQATLADSVTFTFSSSECRSITRLAERHYGADPSISPLIQRLHDATSLAQWLRSEIRLNVSVADAALLRDLRRHVNRCFVEDAADAQAIASA